jgi:hypothetical protein
MFMQIRAFLVQAASTLVNGEVILTLAGINEKFLVGSLLSVSTNSTVFESWHILLCSAAHVGRFTVLCDRQKTVYGFAESSINS